MGGDLFLHDQLQPYDSIKNIHDVFDSENGVLEMNEADREDFFLKLQNFLKQHKGEQREYYSELPMIASQHPGLLVRRENPTFFVESLEKNQPISIVTQEGAYPNAVLLGSDARGLGIAQVFGRGQQGGMVFTVGFESEPGLRVNKISSKNYQQYSKQDQVMLRHIEGSLLPQSMRFLVMRVPMKLFPHSLMTEEERERLDMREEMKSPSFVYRLYTFPMVGALH